MTQYHPPLPRQGIAPRSLVANLLVSAVSLGLFVWTFQFIQARMTSVISLDAVINGVVIDVQAPQTGVVSNLQTQTGRAIKAGQPLLKIADARIEQLPLQQSVSQLNQQQSELTQARNRLAKLLSFQQELKQENQAQYQLENLEIQQSIDQVAVELQGAEAELELAQVNAARSAQLYAEGVIAKANLDRDDTTVSQRQAEVDSLKKRLEVLKANQQATQLGLSLSRTRSEFDPRIRLQEMQLEIAEQQQRIQDLEQKVKDAAAELAQAQADQQRQQVSLLKAPAPGVIWQWTAQNGQYVQQGDSLGKVVDCTKRWIDVYVDERALRSLQPNTPATVELYGIDAPKLQGKISMIRSGVGRLAAGEEVAVPLSPNLPRTTQVRVDLDSPPTDKAGTSQNQSFCYVGYTGRVTFQVN